MSLSLCLFLVESFVDFEIISRGLENITFTFARIECVAVKIVELDAPVTVSLVLTNWLNNLVVASLLNGHRTLLGAFKRVKIRHIFIMVNL